MVVVVMIRVTDGGGNSPVKLVALKLSVVVEISFDSPSLHYKNKHMLSDSSLFLNLDGFLFVH